MKKLSLTIKTDDVSIDTREVTTQVVMGGSGTYGLINNQSYGRIIEHFGGSHFGAL